MVSPGDEYSPAHSNGQTTRKDLRDHVLLSPAAIRQGIQRKGVINPSSDGAEVASSVLSWQELGRGPAVAAPALRSARLRPQRQKRGFKN